MEGAHHPMSADRRSVLELDGLRVRRGARDVLRHVSLSVSLGEIVALTGASGSGKTTVLRCIAGLEQPDGGTVRAAPCGMVFQFHCLFEHLSAIENVTLAPRHVRGVSRAESEQQAYQLLNDLGVAQRATALPRELSGGEAQRVAIARALANRPRIILADEPTAALDSGRAQLVMDLLRKLATEQEACIIAVTHDEKIFDRFDRLIHLRDGRLVDS